MRRCSFRNFFAVLFLAECIFTFIGCNPQATSNKGQSTPAQMAPTSNVAPGPSQASYDLTTIDNILERAASRFGGSTLLLIKRSEERRVGKECRSRWWQE